MICKRPIKLYHYPHREQLRAIVKRGFSRKQSRDFHLAHKIPFPAVLRFVGMPLLKNQRCCWHDSSKDGTSLSFFPHRDKGHWVVHCNNSECRIQGSDIVDFWFELVKCFGWSPPSWSRFQACADLLARVESGEIDVRIKDFERQSASHGSHGRPAAAAPDVDVERDVFCSWDGYWKKLISLLSRIQDGRLKEG